MTSEKISKTDEDAAARALVDARQLGLNLGDAWALEAARKASKMFGNQALKPMAAILASAHPYALDYIKQAPILVPAVLVGQKRLNARKRLFAIGQWATICAKGQTLRDVMRLFRLPVQLRQLSAGQLAPSHWAAITSLAKVDPSTLAQIIPPKYQHSWIRACDAWIARMQRTPANTGHDADGRILLLDWLGRHWQDEPDNLKGAPAAAADMADFAYARRQHFNPKWTWQQAQAAMERWHVELAKLKVTGPDLEVDTRPFPRSVEIAGFEFTALNTRVELVVEGAAMHHCVGSYGEQLVSGRSRIISVKKDGKRVATAEYVLEAAAPYAAFQEYGKHLKDVVQHGRWRLVQFKGPCNGTPASDARDALSAYARAIRDLVQTKTPPAIG